MAAASRLTQVLPLLPCGPAPFCERSSVAKTTLGSCGSTSSEPLASLSSPSERNSMPCSRACSAAALAA